VIMSLPEPGHRVTVRRILGGTRDAPQVGDVVGWLLSADERELRVERRDGKVVRVPRPALLLCKVIPDHPGRSRPARAVSPEGLTRICSLGWPAVHRSWLGEWELRAAAGFTGRANSAAVAGDPGVPTSAALSAIRDFAATHGIPARAQVIERSAWDAEIQAAGWAEPASGHTSALVQVAELGTAPPADPRVHEEGELTDAWLTVYGRPGDPAAARAVLAGPPRVNLLAVGSPPVAVGRAVATGEWLGIAAVAVRPEHRRNGLARAIIETALAWGWSQGCDKAYLQVEPDNEAALRLYEQYGFTTHHAYHYLQPSATAGLSL